MIQELLAALAAIMTLISSLFGGAPSPTLDDIGNINNTIYIENNPGYKNATESDQDMLPTPNRPPTLFHLESDKKSPQNEGTQITWTAYASDPDGDNILYRFFLNGEPQTGWVTDNSWTWATTEDDIGDKQIEVHIRDGEHAPQDGSDGNRAEKFSVLKLVDIPLLLELKIISHSNGDPVPIYGELNGTYTGTIPDGKHVWLVDGPMDSPHRWPQGGDEIILWDGYWDHTALFGGPGQGDVGKKFEVLVILVNDSVSKYYENYLDEGKRKEIAGEPDPYPGIRLPDEYKLLDKVIVERIDSSELQNLSITEI
jgi:hypothetical protein